MGTVEDFSFYLDNIIISKKRIYKNDCALVCLLMIAKYYYLDVDYTKIKKLCNLKDEGTSLFNLNQAAKKIGFQTMMVDLPFKKLFSVTIPCIAHINKNHFVVICGISKYKIFLADPFYSEIRKISHKDFITTWAKKDGADSGVLLLIEL